MEFQEKLHVLRKERKMSQEDVAEILGVSRQAVQKWEAGTASPDMKNLLGISRYFNISLDILLKDELTLEENTQSTNDEHEASHSPVFLWSPYEYKSERKWLGLPLIHINLGYGRRTAKGIVAIGNVAMGLISIGGLSLGLFSIGGLSLGLIAMCGLGLGGLVIGGIVAGIVAIGAIAVGVLAIGAAAFGAYALGAVAIASKIAAGVVAKGYLAIGENVSGVVVATGALNSQQVKELILQEFPRIWEPLAWLFSLALR